MASVELFPETPDERFHHHEPLVFLRGKLRGGLVAHAGKTLRLSADGSLSKISDYNAGALAVVSPATAHDADSFFDAIQRAAAQPGLYWIRGRLTTAGEESLRQCGVIRRTKSEKADKRLPGINKVDPACFEEFPRRGHMIDVDSGIVDELLAAGVDIYCDPEGAARVVASYLPDWARRGPLLWSLSGSSGTKGRHDARFHFFFWTDLPIPAELLKALLRAHNETRPEIVDKKSGKPNLLDVSVLQAVQPHYLAAPLVYDEAGKLVSDPLPQRWGRLAGELPHSPLPVVDLFAAAAGSQNMQQRVTKHTRVKTAPGDTATFGELAKRSSLPRTSAGCQRLIGDGEGLHGFHEPTRQAIFWKLVELLEAGSADALADVEGYLVHLQQVIDAAPKGAHDSGTVADRRDIGELRRMAHGAIARAVAVVRARSAKRLARVAPLFPDTEVQMAEAQADLKSFIGEFFTEAADHHAYHEGYRRRSDWWREHRGNDTRGLVNFLRINTRYAAYPHYIAAHETGVAKSSGVQAQLAQLDLTKWRVFYLAPNHAACEQVRADLASKHGVDAFVLKGIDYVDADGHPICEADQQLKEFAERAGKAQASQRETACVICPLRARCSYLEQAEAMRRPGIKVLPHAFLQSDIPGLTGKDAAPLFCVVLDEKFTDALKVSLSGSWGENEKGSTPPDKWARDLAARFADAQATSWGTQDIALLKLAQQAQTASQHYNDVRSAAQDDLRADIKANGVDAAFDYASLGRRQHLKFIAHFAQLVRDQVDLGCSALQGFRARWEPTKDGGRRLQARISYRALLPDFGCPVLALDATHDDRLTTAIFAERRTVQLGSDAYRLGEPVAPYFAPKYRRVRVKKPHEHAILVPNAPAAKGAIGTEALKPSQFQRVPAKVKASGAAVVRRPDGKFDVYPPRQRRDSHFEQVTRALRWFTEGASHDTSKQVYSAGVFAHKEAREYWAAHGMLGANVRPGHHGVGTALNDWKDVERFAVVGVTRLDDDRFAEEAESYFALAPWADRPHMTKRASEAGIRLRDGTGYPVQRWAFDDERVDALYRQIGEAQLEQELGRTRSVWRTKDNPVTVLVMANAIIDRTFDAVLVWEQLASLTPFDVAASAGVVPTKAHELDKLLPGLFASPHAAKLELQELRADPPGGGKTPENAEKMATRKNGSRGCIENLYIGARAVFAGADLSILAGALPAGLCDTQLVLHDVVLKRSKDLDRVQVLAAPSKPEALERYAAALGKTLRSATPAPPPAPPAEPILLPPVPHCSPEQAGTNAAKPRWRMVVTYEPLPEPDLVPWPELAWAQEVRA